ncbi:tumor necrosis factor receptor superfamily member 19L [Genypterus blacodes]|uniref:tumor necrosis factor receptor superfamily member 19L n=1 Tax=Genypterus blacodes TaxID=154954 RepID=UPI003F764B83
MCKVETVMKMKIDLCCSALVLFTVLTCGGSAAAQCRWGEGCVCLHCPAGQQPNKLCAELQTGAEEVTCRLCPAGTFSHSLDSEMCRPHTSCETLSRKVTTLGTITSDVVCGDCLPGFTLTAVSTQTPCVKYLLVRGVRTVGEGPLHTAGGPVNGTVLNGPEENTAEYAVFALVPIFCVTGLLGIFICNMLKKKGSNCIHEKEGRDVEIGTTQKEGSSCPNISEDLNEDTISGLIRLITEKKENAAALEELLLEYENKQVTRKGSTIKLCPHLSHLHTISGLKHGCSRCAQRRWPAVLIPTHDPFKDPLKAPKTLILPSLYKVAEQQRSPLLGGVCVKTQDTHTNVPNSNTAQGKEGKGEQEDGGGAMVLSVGRFQVAQIHEKLITTETNTSTQEPRGSWFGSRSFSSSSSGIRR